MVISGLPGSGKSTLARRLAPRLHLPVLDKDDILERLYDTRGVGDEAWRSSLSREADRVLRDDALAANGALLVSHWRVPGMSSESGTPTEWLRDLRARLVHLHCVCDPDVAARRFLNRTRHPGHLDASRSPGEIAASIHAVAALPMPDLGRRIDVDTMGAADIDRLSKTIGDDAAV